MNPLNVENLLFKPGEDVGRFFSFNSLLSNKFLFYMVNRVQGELSFKTIKVSRILWSNMERNAPMGKMPRFAKAILQVSSSESNIHNESGKTKFQSDFIFCEGTEIINMENNVQFSGFYLNREKDSSFICKQQRKESHWRIVTLSAWGVLIDRSEELLSKKGNPCILKKKKKNSLCAFTCVILKF